jgi:7-carboxy-7-deazaguanine synthase
VKISEIFHSIQGEGSLVGVPSVFVRTSGCNLRCVWCDTPYTSWNPEGTEMGLDAIVAAVEAFQCGHVVLTGGEPMIAPQAGALTEMFHQRGWHITIETAGTVHHLLRCDLMSISPKLENSTPHERDGGRWAVMHERLRYQPDILKKLTADYDYQLKFVISSAEDLDELRRIQEAIGAPANRILLMPEGVTREAMTQRGLWLAELCKQHGYRYSPRLHIDIWGDKRGV